MYIIILTRFILKALFNYSEINPLDNDFQPGKLILLIVLVVSILSNVLFITNFMTIHEFLTEHCPEAFHRLEEFKETGKVSKNEYFCNTEKRNNTSNK